ncbi:MAG: hypothetical protein PWQ86_1890 [Bacillota bacterium]|nr:hypothetical protein [Bacillota bacterium]MDK2856677.1 hypothetical protein [Bacillota bacterium]
MLHVLSDTGVGGAGRYVLNLLPGLRDQGIEVAVACPGGGELAKELARRGWQPLPLSRGEASFSWRSVAEVYRYLKAGGYDLVHTHASLAGRMAARLAGARGLVLTRHGLGSGAPAAGYRRQVNRWASRLLTDAIIAISEAVAAQLVAEGVDRRQIRVVPSGIDWEEFARASGAAVRRELGLGSRPVVGMVARLVPEKAPADFLKAAALVKQELPDAGFLLVGEGPLEQDLRGLAARLGLQDNLYFLGYRRDVPGVTAALDVAVLTSKQEGLGLVLLEAMAAAKPVVATAAGGIPEVVEQGVTGLLVSPGRPDQVAAAVLQLLRDRDLAAKLGRAGQELVARKFSLTAMAQGTAEVYRALLERKGGRG